MGVVSQASRVQRLIAGGSMNKILFGDCRTLMNQMIEDGLKAQTCVTSPPYFGLRDYGVDGQFGLESTVDE